VDFLSPAELELVRQGGVLALFVVWAHRYLLPELRAGRRENAAGHLRTHALLGSLLAGGLAGDATRKIDPPPPPTGDEVKAWIDEVKSRAEGRLDGGVAP
jgi:hypothetical protein